MLTHSGLVTLYGLGELMSLWWIFNALLMGYASSGDHGEPLAITWGQFQKAKIHIYHKTSNISCTLLGNNIVDHSDVVGASPVGAAPTTSSFST